MSGNRREFSVSVGSNGETLAGWVTGSGEPVLFLHGGPGLSFEHVDGIAPEFAGYQFATFQQRGVKPSTTDGPFDVDTFVDDVIAVLDHLGWKRAWIAGHSWGGHLALHVAKRAPQRVRGGLAIDPLGAARWNRALSGQRSLDYGGLITFNENMQRRIDELAAKGIGDPNPPAPDTMDERTWMAYFANPAQAPSMTSPIEVSYDVLRKMTISELKEMPALEAALANIAVPFRFLVGNNSPMPNMASWSTAAAMPNAIVTQLSGTGHMVWIEKPGAIRAGMADLKLQAKSASGPDQREVA